jgi:hypothetical protein
MGSAAGVPTAIECLRDARDDEEANKFFWRIDNTVVVQGQLYEAAEYTIPCVLAALHGATVAGRWWLLHLLYQLGAGVSANEEVAAGNANLDKRCRAEVKLGTSMYFHYLEYGTVDERGHAADLLSLCCKGDPALATRVVWWLRRIVDSNEYPKLAQRFERYIREIPEQS